VRNWKKIFFIYFSTFLLFYFSTFANAAFESRTFLARPAGMCGAFVSISNDANAPFYNPAGLNLFSATSLSFSQVSLYGESSLKYQDFGFSLPTVKLGSFALNMTSFGSGFYRERQTVFTHSFLLTQGGYIGYNLRFLSLDIENTSSASSFAFDFGALGLVSTKLAIGFVMKGLNRPQIAGEDIYRELSYGISWRPFRGMVSAFEWVIPADRDENIFHSGIEFTVTPSFCMRFGIQTYPIQTSFGFGLMLKFFDIDYAFQTHESLSNQHLFSLSFRWGEKRELAAPAKYRRKKKKKTRKVKSRISAPSGEIVEKVNINTADVSELDSLPGIGKVTAHRIVEYRKAHGPFKSIEDLLNVPRFRKRVLEKIRDYIYVGKVSEEEVPEEEFPPEEEEEKPEKPARKKLSEGEITKLKKQYYYQGLKLYQAGNYEEAIKFFEKILKLDPTHPQSIRLIEKCKKAIENRK